MNKFQFFINFLKDPHIAAILPSSRFVLRKVLNMIPFEKTKIIVEYLPGTGVLTKRLLQQLREDGKLIAIERNKEFYEVLKKINDKRLHLFNEDARNVDVCLQKMNISKADIVLSAIPISYLKPNEKNDFLEKTKKILSKDGKFIVYSQHSSHARPYLKNFFEKVRLKIELRNIPPAFIFEAS
jgi:phospholipid N-methyltransferase